MMYSACPCPTILFSCLDLNGVREATSPSHHRRGPPWHVGIHIAFKSLLHMASLGSCDTQAPLARTRFILSAIARAARPRRKRKNRTTAHWWADISSPDDKLRALGTA